MTFKKGQSGNPATQFGRGQPTNLGGRKKKIYTILQEKGYSADDIKTAFNEMAFYTLAELKAVAKKKDTPAIVIVVAMAFKNAIENGDWRYIREIMEHTIGKAPQSIDLTTKGEKVQQFQGFGFLPDADKEEEPAPEND